MDIANLGALTDESRPTIEDDGILVQYSNGQSCGSNGGAYKTKIHLKCQQGALVRIKTPKVNFGKLDFLTRSDLFDVDSVI